jgi:hypothetical protein
MASEIALTRGLFPTVDDEDYERISAFRWRASGAALKPYAITGFGTVSKSSKPPIYMHRMILECPAGMVIDHINNNGLDNRRSNLRFCTHRQNIARSNTANRVGSSGFIGVFPSVGSSTFYARIGKKGLGSFRNPEDAARAYDAASIEEFGEFARLNFPEEHAADRTTRAMVKEVFGL